MLSAETTLSLLFFIQLLLLKGRPFSPGEASTEVESYLPLNK